MGILSSIGKTLLDATKTFETVVQHPVQSIKTIGNGAAFNELSQKTNSQPLVNQIGNILLSTGTAAALVIGGGAALGSTTARSIGTTVLSSANKLVPSTTKGKVIAAIAAPVVGSAIISNPGGALSAVTKTAKAQIDLGKVIANPSVSSAEQYLKEHPGASVAIGAGTVAAIGGGLGLAANTAATFLNSRATNANTAASEIPDKAALVLPTQKGISIEPIEDKPATASIAPPEQLPKTPQTQTVSPGGTNKRKKHYRKLTIAPISQKVNVIVSNRSIGTTNKTYLNRGIYA